MKMPNDDFLEPLKKRPNKSPNKSFQDSLHEKMLEEVKRRRSMASWKFRLGVVAVLLLLIIINPLELLMNDNSETKSNSSEMLPSPELPEQKVNELEVKDIVNDNALSKALHEALIAFGVPEESADVFITYHYGLLNNELTIIEQYGFLSNYEKDEMIEKLLHYYRENVDLSTFLITDVQRSLGEPEFFVTVQYSNFKGDLFEIDYILAGNGEYVYDPMKNLNKYFIQRKILEVNSATIVVPYFQGQLNGIGESSSLEELNMLIQNNAIISSYDNFLGMHGDVTGKIIYDIEPVLSIEFIAEWSSDELAHPYITSFFLTFDLAKGRVLSLLDFVLEEEFPQLEQSVIEKIKIDKMYKALVDNLDAINISKNQSFYLSTMDGGIVLYYPRYTLSSMSEVRIHPSMGILN